MTGYGWRVYTMKNHRTPRIKKKKSPRSRRKAIGKPSPPQKRRKTDKTLGAKLVLRNLDNDQEWEIDFVSGYAFDPRGRYLVYAVSAAEGEGNGVFYRELKNGPGETRTLMAADNTLVPALAWDHEGHRLAFLQQPKPEKEPKKDAIVAADARLQLWRPETNALTEVTGLREGWGVSNLSNLTWTKNGQRLFFESKPRSEQAETPKADEPEIDLYDIDRLAAKRGLDIWHGQDPSIKTHERMQWKNERKRAYLTVWHASSGKTIQLADPDLPDAKPTENEHILLATSDIPYRRESTWAGFFRDVSVVRLADGGRTPLVERAQSGSDREFTLSPTGRFAAFYKDGQLYLVDLKDGGQRRLTTDLSVSFANEIHDYPSSPPGYGFAGWLEKDQAVLAYDRYDLWRFPTDGSAPQRLTEGREVETVFRIVDLDEDQQFFKKKETLLLTAYHDKQKHNAFYRLNLAKPGAKPVLTGKKWHEFIAKAKKADRLIYSREDFREFPDLWVAKTNLEDRRKLTEENPQIAEFLWGEPELVSWRSVDGEPLQGVLIKPGDYEPGKRYPVVVYYYRLFSQRMYRFNQMAVNHRPNFPFYTSNGYAIFLPDIRFKVGTPGLSAVKALTPGVQKLIEMGVADEKAIGLHGHSWSGYQTAHVITQSDLFACAVAGAPVSNMTSAYSGIRLGSGLARQFQYETAQSRIGGSLWENRDLYIENSPVFFADRINTPLLIMFGDKDDAVPWEQGIELYLALRRLDKDVVFLQYRGEPHHLKKYPNKVDYTIKMKEYFDHYLKGGPQPDWLAHGEPYRGEAE